MLAAAVVAAAGVLPDAAAETKRAPRRALRRTGVAIAERPVKICQLVGDFDRERQEETLNLTRTRAGVGRTDLGSSFRHAGKTWFLFGDTGGAIPGARDPIAWSDDDTPEDCLALTFVADGPLFRPVTVPGITHGGFEVPIAGLEAGGSMILYHSTDTYTRPDGTTAMGRTVVAQSGDGGRTFAYLYELSDTAFINVSPVTVATAAWSGLPAAAGDTVLLFGSGDYRRSDVRLAVQPLGGIGSRASLRYLAGLGAGGAPMWSADESQASPLFDHPCVGELSVTYNPALELFVMLYNCGGGIILRTAPRPWGPWSPPQTLFDARRDGGYCHYMHVAWSQEHCDEVQDDGTDDVWGGAYGPFQIAELATTGNGASTIYFTMSTWNPYTVVLMRATLTR
jgi:hypothetical protein